MKIDLLHHPDGDLPDPRGLLFSAIPAKTITEVISISEEGSSNHGTVHTSTDLHALPSETWQVPVKIVAAVAAQDFSRKLEEQGDKFNPFRRV